MLKNKLGTYLSNKQITPYRLAKDSGISPTTIYGLINDPEKEFNRQTMNSIFQTLKTLGCEAQPNDLLEVSS